MPAARPTSARFLVLTLFLISVFGLPLPHASRARVAACPVAPPVPLRMLFKQSERVVVATAGESARALTDQVAYEEGPKMFTLKTTFNVSESLKGDPSETTLVVHQWGGYENHPAESEYERGERRLLFLEPVEGGGGYSVTDYRYGAKKLTDDELKIYILRINELSAILQKEKPDEAEILEWLVRCAEEKATRWEGAYELSASVRMVADREEARQQQEAEGDEVSEEEEAAGEDGEQPEAEATGEAASEAASEAATEEVGAAEEVAVEAEESVEGSEGESVTVEREVWIGDYGTDIEAGAASKLSAEQKGRLLSALFGADEVAEGEQALIQIAKDSGDARLVPFLVKQLRRMDAEPTYEAHLMVMALAHVLKDKAVADLAEDYCTNAPYSEFVEDESEESEAESEDESAAALSQKEAAAAGKEKVTGAQRRSEMLRAFLAAVDNKIQYDLAMQLSR